MPERIINVVDRRHGWIGAWEVEPLVYGKLGTADIGRTVIYCPSHGNPEAGTLSIYRGGLVFARFHSGETAAPCAPEDLMFGVRPCDGDLDR